jgi:hypothetical protein
MKTSNKTNRRFLGIAVVMMVLSLVNANLSAQESFNENSLAEFSGNFFLNIKYEIIHAISESNVEYSELDSETIEDWMMNPTEWKDNNVENLVEEVSFEEKEMILEDWMMKANWEDNSLIEEELQIEDWMTNPANWNKNK